MKVSQATKMILQPASVSLCIILLAACSNQPKQDLPNLQNYATGGVKVTPLKSNKTYINDDLPVLSSSSKTSVNSILEGNGVFLNMEQIPKAKAGIKDDPETISLNFEQADLREVITTILKTLGHAYIIDPSISGSVTINMPEDKPLKRSQLLPTLEKLLAMNGAALLKEGALYRIVPLASAVAGNSNIYTKDKPDSANLGHGTRIYPLKFISASEMVTILTPFIPQGSLIQADSARNMITVSGSPADLDALQATIDTFDVNWLKGMSVGIFSLDTMDAETAATQLTALLGVSGEGQTPMAGLLRFVPLTKINTLMVISPQKEYLREVETWIKKIDNSSGERLYVYNVENGDAGYLAEVLGQIFASGGGSGGGSAVAPGLGSSNLTSGLARGGSKKNSNQTGSGSSGSSSQGSSLTGGSFNTTDDNVSPSSQALSGGGNDLGMFGGRNVRVVADASNNAILIWASPRDYDKVIAAIRRVDKTPRQVLIEATFAEVSLAGNLKYGLQWFFKNSIEGNQGAGALGPVTTIKPDGNLVNLAGALASNTANQFVYGVANSAGNISALLSALAGDSVLNILSSPQVLARDNQEATIKVGGQVPIATNSITTIGNNSTSNGLTQSYTFKDTGVILHVKPKVNSSGLVSLDIEQEITDIDEAVGISTTTNNPSFLTRSLQTKVSVQDGQTIVLGGLISERSSTGKSGLPGLYKIPVLGSLFGSTTKNVDRKELMILITPRVIKNAGEAKEASEELRTRMSNIQPLLLRNKR